MINNPIDIMIKHEGQITEALDRETGRKIANVTEARIEYDVVGLPTIYLTIRPHKTLFYSISKENETTTRFN